MKKMLIGFALATASTLTVADAGIKAGLWEVQVVKQIMDGQDMAAQQAAAMAQMQAQMANMPPAQRKQMEQMMGGRQAMPSANVHRVCISPEMAARDKPVVPPDSRCEPGKYERSGNRTTFEMKCPDMTGKGESIVSGDTISTKMDMVMTDPRGRHTMQSESRMKYLGPDCQGLKPADQMAREMQAGGRK